MAALLPFARSASLRRCQLRDLFTRPDHILWRSHPASGRGRITSVPFVPGKRSFNQHSNAGGFHSHQTSRTSRISWLSLGVTLSYALLLWQWSHQRKVNEDCRREIEALKGHLSRLASAPAAVPDASKDRLLVPLALEELDHHGDPERALQISNRLLEAIFMADRGGSFIPLTAEERQAILPRLQRARSEAEKVRGISDKDLVQKHLLRFMRGIKTARDNGDKVAEALCVYKYLKVERDSNSHSLDNTSDKQVRRYLYGLINLDESIAESRSKIDGPMLAPYWSASITGGPIGEDLRAHLNLINRQAKSSTDRCATMNVLACLDLLLLAKFAIACTLQAQGRDVPKQLSPRAVISEILHSIPQRLATIDNGDIDESTANLIKVLEHKSEVLKQLSASFEA